MLLTETQQSKVDEHLLGELRNAKGDEKITVCMSIVRAVEWSSEAPEPSQYPDRVAWRRALIAFRQQEVRESISDVLEQLRAMELQILGGNVSHMVVVLGTAQRIAEALSLQRVGRAVLDQPLSPPRPRRGTDPPLPT